MDLIPPLRRIVTSGVGERFSTSPLVLWGRMLIGAINSGAGLAPDVDDRDRMQLLRLDRDRHRI
jgi:hypothetical protein